MVTEKRGATFWIGAAGAALLAIWAALMLVFAGPTWSNWLTGVAGAVLVAFWAYVERAELRRLVLSPQLRHGGNAMTFTVTVVAALALLNVIATRHSFRFDLTANKFYSLSDQTEKILRGLNRKVKITFFTKTGNPDSGQVMDLLGQYKHACSQVDVEQVDTDQKPDKAIIYKISSYNTVVFESGGKRKDVMPQELFGYQFAGQQPQREFKGEPVITAAILSVTQDRQRTVCFLEGHGERSVEDVSDNGIAELKTGLERDNYVVKTLNLMKEGKVPADADIIVIAGPRKGIPEPERRLLDDYLAKDGRLLVMLDPESTGGLDSVLSPWGITVLSGMVADPRSNYFFGGPLVPIPTYLGHKITDDLRKQGVGVMLPGTRALEAGKLDKGAVTKLLETTPESWLEKDWRSGSAPKYDAGKDKKGPFALGLAVTLNPPSEAKGPDASPEPPQPIAKLVAYGGITWVTNGIRGNSEANFDLFANSVNWLAGSDITISIRPKEVTQRRVFLDSVKARLMWWVTVILIPLAVIGIGVFRWWNRRSL